MNGLSNAKCVVPPRPAGEASPFRAARPARYDGSFAAATPPHGRPRMSATETLVRLQMRHITKNFGGVHALRDVSVDRARRRGPRALRRERRGQEHADEDPGRRDHRLRRRDRARRPAGRVLRPARRRGRRHPDHLPGAEPRPRADGRRQHLPRPRADGAASAGSTTARWRPRRAGSSSGWARRSRPRARVGDLRIGDQQMVEIAKALAFDAAILIMDEPTSALSDAEVARLFRVIDDLRAAGHDGPLHLAQDERGLHAGRPRDRAPRRPVRRHRAARPRRSPGAGRPLDGRPRDRRAALRAPASGGRDASFRSGTCRLPSPPDSGRPSL